MTSYTNAVIKLNQELQTTNSSKLKQRSFKLTNLQNNIAELYKSSIERNCDSGNQVELRVG